MLIKGCVLYFLNNSNYQSVVVDAGMSSNDHIIFTYDAPLEFPEHLAIDFAEAMVISSFICHFIKSSNIILSCYKLLGMDLAEKKHTGPENSKEDFEILLGKLLQ